MIMIDEGCAYHGKEKDIDNACNKSSGTVFVHLLCERSERVGELSDCTSGVCVRRIWGLVLVSK